MDRNPACYPRDWPDNASKTTAIHFGSSQNIISSYLSFIRRQSCLVTYHCISRDSHPVDCTGKLSAKQLFSGDRCWGFQWLWGDWETGYPQWYRIGGFSGENFWSCLQVTRVKRATSQGKAGAPPFPSRLSTFPSTWGAPKSTICLPVLTRRVNTEKDTFKLLAALFFLSWDGRSQFWLSSNVTWSSPKSPLLN